jgi:hypothetical protein
LIHPGSSSTGVQVTTGELASVSLRYAIAGSMCETQRYLLDLGGLRPKGATEGGLCA